MEELRFARQGCNLPLDFSHPTKVTSQPGSSGWIAICRMKLLEITRFWLAYRSRRHNTLIVRDSFLQNATMEMKEDGNFQIFKPSREWLISPSSVIWYYFTERRLMEAFRSVGQGTHAKLTLSSTVNKEEWGRNRGKLDIGWNQCAPVIDYSRD